MDRSELFDEFVRRLNGFDSRAAADPGGEFIEITRWEGAPLVPPVRLAIDASSLERHLHALEGDGAEVFPDAPPPIGALQLFLVHVGEEIETRGPDDELLTLHGDDLSFLGNAP
ncbi:MULTISPECIES: hypothetical protein [Nonomuraea]|jgi:hypothetical protein|uniref:Uncharacterized protein n=1 Tax=Nonomuraea ferruginea TaxID=46174 RepID=A0ABT4SPU0_9ACTN|nr:MULTISPECIES: hypothetical protein [Nonomuraea]MDA0639261.1 hypothetical protein [Nonomuraea ferruginea]TXK35414.1 hypothetical protein FR742_40000 [Nonomuraea sp. C10]